MSGFFFVLENNINLDAKKVQTDPKILLQHAILYRHFQ